MVRWPLQDCPVRSCALRDTEAKIRWDYAGRRNCEPVIQMRSRLAPNGNDIFKARGSYKGDTRAFALQQDICSHCGSMADECSIAVRYRANGFHHRVARVFGCGEYLQDLQLEFFEIDAIREGAACVDCNLHWFCPL